MPLIREFYQAGRHEFAPDRVGRALAPGLLHPPRVRDRGLGLDEPRADRVRQPPGRRRAPLIAGRESLVTGAYRRRVASKIGRHKPLKVTRLPRTELWLR